MKDLATVSEFAEARKAREEAAASPRFFLSATGEKVEPLDFLRERLRLSQLERVVRQGQDAQAVDLELRGGITVRLGRGRDVLEPRKLRGAIYEQAGVVIPRMKGDQHDKLAEVIYEAAEVRDAALSEAEQTCGWLNSYLSRGWVPEGRLDPDDRETLVDLLGPPGEAWTFRGADERLYVRLQPLAKHVQLNAARTTQQDLATRLGRLGFERKQLTVRDGDRTLKARYWVSPPGFVPGEFA